MNQYKIYAYDKDNDRLDLLISIDDDAPNTENIMEELLRTFGNLVAEEQLKDKNNQPYDWVELHRDDERMYISCGTENRKNHYVQVLLQKKENDSEKDETEMFEDYLTERNDIIDNAVYQLILTLTEKSADELEWDMNIIGDVIDAIDEILYKKGIHICRPYHEIGPNDNDEEQPCYQGTDCKRTDCPFKKTKGEEQ